MGTKESLLKFLIMIIKIFTIGNKLNQWESEGIEFYTKQLPKNLEVEFINLKSQQNKSYSTNEVIEKESNTIMSKIPKHEYIVAWDSNGEKITSESFANFILDHQRINPNISFIIGGSFGLSATVKKRSDRVFSASLLTFPHRLFRLILMEQIYRAHSIITNMPYHK